MESGEAAEWTARRASIIADVRFSSDMASDIAPDTAESSFFGLESVLFSFMGNLPFRPAGQEPRRPPFQFL